MQMPLTKVDKVNRTVSGWATLDNPDLQDDVVEASASLKAFSRFRGNIREMHQPIAVGRMLKYHPDRYYDPETKKFYDGIYVTAYVSKGAESTWEKVLDGTLSMFSIKGPIRESVNEFSKDYGKALRIVKDYDLEELSLVDSGGNQLANVISFAKSVDGEMSATGIMAETTVENVFWCPVDKIAKTSTEDSVECPEGHKMENIGWFEYEEAGDELEKLQAVIKDYLDKDNNNKEQAEPVENEGGVDVADKNETVNPGEVVPEVQPADEQGKAESEVNASVESAADVEEVAADKKEAANVSEVDADSDLQKSLEELKARIEDGAVQNETAVADLMKSIDEKFKTIEESLEKKISELDSKQAELTKSIESVKEGLESMSKSVSGLQDSTAVKKSGDLGGSTGEETLVKSGSSVWAGTIL